MKRKLSLTELKRKEMGEIKGAYDYKYDPHTGVVCGCGCYYSASGGSSTLNNKNANFDDGLFSFQM
jgi:hypothetical protein